MNLYKIMFNHYSPKDSERGIIAYLIANSDEEVYEWIKSEPIVEGRDVNKIYNCWKECEEEDEYEIYDDDCNVVGIETFKERMIRLGGEMFDEEADISDSYYGVTQLGWDIHKENIESNEIDMLLKLKIAYKA